MMSSGFATRAIFESLVAKTFRSRSELVNGAARTAGLQMGNAMVRRQSRHNGVIA
jgi:metal-responsive CopG/Arc/MetJ family transcriptional regulator